MRKYFLILAFDIFVMLLLVSIFIINKDNFYNYFYLFLFNVFTIIPLFYFLISLMDVLSNKKLKFYFISALAPFVILIISLLIETIRSFGGNPDFTNFSASLFNSSLRIILTLIGFGILIIVKWIRKLLNGRIQQS